MSGGVAVIEVGAATEVELKDKKYRLEDALNATRAAVEEGIVAGGGTTLIDILPALDEFNEDGDVQTGINLVKRAIELRSARSLKTLASKVRSSLPKSKLPKTA